MPHAVFEVMRARRNGIPFASMLLVPDRRAEYVYALAADLVKSEPDYEVQRLYFNAVADGVLNVEGKTINERLESDGSLGIIVKELAHMSDLLVVRSWTEWKRIREMGASRAHVVRWYPERHVPPAQARGKKDVVVIWAPDYGAEQTSIHTFSLHNLLEEMVVVCNGGSGFSSRCRYVDAASPEVPSILQRALCVVDATLDDPGWAHAFARAGYPLAASTTSGAHEVADNLVRYLPWSHASIWSAAVDAIGRSPAVPREAAPSAQSIVQGLTRAQPRMPRSEPLVTVIVPTYNRPADLARCVAALVAQRYECLEILIVNDAGEPPVDLPHDPRIRVLNLEKNVGAVAAINAGMRAARGDYVQIVADDDALYPDHVIRLVEVLERTGADVAHSNAVIRYEGTGPTGATITTGYNASVFCHPLDRVVVYSSSPVAGQALLVRRSALERVGYYDEQCILADQELQIRLSQVSEFMHVPHATAEWLVRAGGGQYFQQKQKDVVADPPAAAR
jgi:hypothetical protein